MYTDVKDELYREQRRYDKEDQRRLYERLEEECPNNSEQKEVIEILQHVIQKPQEGGYPEFFFINGVGGSGKTTVARKLAAWARSQGHIVQICASITLAVTNYDNAMTAHNLFRFPVIDEYERDADEKTVGCKLYTNRQRLHLLRNTRVIIWDEFPTNHREILESIVDGPLHKSDCEGGLLFICLGDFQQTLPIVQGGGDRESLHACIISSHIWPYYNMLKLTQNMRLEKLSKEIPQNATEEYKAEVRFEMNYRDSIQAVGKGQTHIYAPITQTDSDNEYHMHVRLPLIDVMRDKEETIKWLYPNGYDADRACGSCILTVTNKSADVWNEAIQAMNTFSMVHTFVSTDNFCEVDDPNGYIHNNMKEDKIFDIFNHNGVPPHRLSLKINDVCIVLRALPYLGIPTNARVRIVEFLETSCFLIKVELLNHSNAHNANYQPVYAYIPRIRFKFRMKYGISYSLMRQQYPLRLAYGMTINKSQSQTLNTVLLDCTEEAFAHGQTYVALSRVRSGRNIKIYRPVTSPAVDTNHSHANPADNSNHSALEESSQQDEVSNVVYTDLIQATLLANIKNSLTNRKTLYKPKRDEELEAKFEELVKTHADRKSRTGVDEETVTGKRSQRSVEYDEENVEYDVSDDEDDEDDSSEEDEDSDDEDDAEDCDAEDIQL